MTAAVRDRLRRWRETARSRLVERAAHRILDEREFRGYLNEAAHRDYLVEQARAQAVDATTDLVAQRAAFRRRYAAATGAASGVAVLLAPMVPAGAAAARAAWDWAGMPGLAVAGIVAIPLLVALLRRAGGLGVRLVNERRMYRAALRERLRPLLRRAVMDVAEDGEAPVLRLASAPGLSAHADRLYRVPRREQDEIITMVRRLGVSAVAISGPRGVGKTTLLRELAESEGPPRELVVQVEAAAAYPARDFIVTLYRALCRTVLAEIRRERRWMITDRPVPMSRRWATRRMRRRAEESLERLQYLQNRTSEAGVTFRAPLKFGPDITGRRVRQLIEQPISLSEVVTSFRTFAEDVASWWAATQRGGGRLVVIIDELDRINDGEAAERFVNEIKGIFGAYGVTYLVAVSEDALALFERRMIGIRPALDSTFEEAVRLDIMSLENSQELLGRRLVGCPRPFMALCHALSGGLPRELIRTARKVVDEAAGAERENGLAALTARVVEHDLRRLKSGFLPRLRREGQTGPVHRVLMDLADPAWPGTSAVDLLKFGHDLIYRPPGDERDCLRLGVSLWYYATLMETFGLPPEPERPCHERLPRAAEGLAVVRSTLPTSVELALDLLIKLRQEFGLTTPSTEAGVAEPMPVAPAPRSPRRAEGWPARVD